MCGTPSALSARRARRRPCWINRVRRAGRLHLHLPSMATRHPILRFRAGDPKNDLHHQRSRGAEPLAAQNHQDARQLPNDEAAMKLLYLAMRNAGIHWRRPFAWTAAMGEFSIQFGERVAGSAD